MFLGEGADFGSTDQELRQSRCLHVATVQPNACGHLPVCLWLPTETQLPDPRQIMDVNSPSIDHSSPR